MPKSLRTDLLRQHQPRAVAARLEHKCSAQNVSDAVLGGIDGCITTSANNEFVGAVRREEERHIEQVPEGGREEVRQISARKGLADVALEHIVATITADRRLWIETMLAERARPARR